MRIQVIQQRDNAGFRLHAMECDVGIHSFNPPGPEFRVGSPGAKVAIQLLLSCGLVQAAHAQGLLPGHGKAQTVGSFPPEPGVQLFRIQHQPVHVKQHAQNRLCVMSGGIVNFKCHGCFPERFP